MLVAFVARRAEKFMASQRKMLKQTVSTGLFLLLLTLRGVGLGSSIAA